MSLKDKLIDTGVVFYNLACCGVGIVAGKFFFNYLHNQDQSTLKTMGVGGLAFLVGLGTAGILMSPLMKRSKRMSLPKCPECKNGKLRKKTEVLGKYFGKWSFGYYGIRGAQELTDCKENISCDRCYYKTSRKYTSEGAIHIGKI